MFACSLSTTYAVSSTAPDEGYEQADRQRHNMRTPWLVVGKYEPQAAVNYLDLAQALEAVRVARVSDQLSLEEWINPQRFSQIRILYNDPRARRGEGDSVVSKAAAWEFVVSDLIGELVGAGPEDEDALAVRYAETTVPVFYIYFSAQLVSYATPALFQRVVVR